MKKIIIILVVVTSLSGFVSAQNIETIRFSGLKFSKEDFKFEYLSSETDTSTVQFVATIKATPSGKKDGFEKLFNKASEESKRLGANLFKVIDFRNGSLIMNSYFGNDSIVSKNLSMREKENNVIYILGNIDNPAKSYSFKLNGEKKEIAGSAYFKYIIKDGEDVKINKGGFTGSMLFLKWKEKRPATYLTLSGLGLGAYTPPPGVIGLSISTGSINYIQDKELANALIDVLQKAE